MKARRTLLLIDDDVDDIFLFEEVLGSIDPTIKFISAENGNRALSLLRKELTELPNIIFLDLNMPGMDGKQCLVELKKDKALQHIPVIIYTTSALRNDAESTIRSGAVCLISKPSSFGALKEILTVIAANTTEISEIQRKLRKYSSFQRS